jgi:hypothetical protein
MELDRRTATCAALAPEAAAAEANPVTDAVATILAKNASCGSMI